MEPKQFRELRKFTLDNVLVRFPVANGLLETPIHIATLAVVEPNASLLLHCHIRIVPRCIVGI